MRTLCWGKLAEDYRLKSILFLAFPQLLFKSQRLDSSLMPGVHTHAHGTDKRTSCESRGKKVSGEKKGQGCRQVLPSTGQRGGADVDKSMKERAMEG